MEQAVHSIVLQWMVNMPVRSYFRDFRHLTRFQLGMLAFEYLSFSTVTWCSMRPAAHRVALQLLLLDIRGEQEEQDLQCVQIQRRVRRAVVRTGLQFNFNDGMVQWVRSLAREYRVERAVSVHARHGDRHGAHREQSERLRRLVAETMREDVDSPSEGEEVEQDQQDEQHSTSSGEEQ